jgi:hypothetical protein
LPPKLISVREVERNRAALLVAGILAIAQILQQLGRTRGVPQAEAQPSASDRGFYALILGQGFERDFYVVVAAALQEISSA